MISQQDQEKTVQNKRSMTVRIRANIATIFLASFAAFLLGTYGCNGEGPCCPNIEEFEAAGFICEEQGYGLVNVEVDVVFTERSTDDSTVSRGSCAVDFDPYPPIHRFRYGSGGIVEYRDENTRWNDDRSRFYGTFFDVRVSADNNTLVFCMSGDDCPEVCKCGERWGELDCPCAPEADETYSVRGDCALITIPVRQCNISVPSSGTGETPDEHDPSHK